MRVERKKYYAEQKELRKHKLRMTDQVDESKLRMLDIDWKKNYKILSQECDDEYASEMKKAEAKLQEEQTLLKQKIMIQKDDIFENDISCSTSNLIDPTYKAEFDPLWQKGTYQF